MLFTSEQVLEGHPDKLADQISDGILDEFLKQDENSRVACEVMVTTGQVHIAGEVTSNAYVDIPKVVREVLLDAGYDNAEYGIDGRNCGILVSIDEQSPDIAQGVDTGGAGDQGMCFGYATNETPECMPMPIILVNKLCRKLAEVRKNHLLNYLRPDGKAQITVEYDDGKPKRVDTIVVSVQHEPYIPYGLMKMDIYEHVIKKVIPNEMIDENTKIYINPTGRFVVGGPQGDCGLTGRKIICDTYGGMARHGGGAFCVDGETEFLTPNGFKKISEYENGDFVGQWEDGVLSFVKPDAYIVNYAEKMYRIQSPHCFDMVLSPNHDVVLETSKGNIIKKRAKDLFSDNGMKNGNSGFVPVAFRFNKTETDVKLTDDEIRLQVAFCADGTFTGSRIRVKKAEKKKRLKELLDKVGVKYTEHAPEVDYAIFRFEPLIKSKSLAECFWGCDSHQLKVIAEEVQKWDGAEGIFRTTIKEDADFIQFAFMATYGTTASISIDDRVGQVDDKGYITKSVCYEVRRKKYKKASLRNSKKINLSVERTTTSDGKMYCFNVPSGMLVLRRNNRVFVTGNSGKDYTKVDRSGAYMARYIAKNVVGAGFADKCEVQIAYAIGKAEPVSVMVETFGTEKIDKKEIERKINKVFDRTPNGIIRMLDLKKPIYKKTATYGHFGRDEFSWEKLDKVEDLKNA